jgi:hypothetical protein
MRVVDWQQVDMLVTTPPPGEFADGLKERGVRLVVAT